MNKTPNYQLSQWEADDVIHREDFNADNAKTDAAIKAVDQRVDTLSAGKADKTALAAKAEIATGSYTGNGAAERFLNLGFTPKAVYICTSYGATFTTGVNSSSSMGGLILPGGPLDASGVIYGQIVTGGVQLYHKRVDSSTRSTNSENVKYHYLALG